MFLFAEIVALPGPFRAGGGRTLAWACAFSLPKREAQFQVGAKGWGVNSKGDANDVNFHRLLNSV